MCLEGLAAPRASAPAAVSSAECSCEEPAAAGAEAPAGTRASVCGFIKWGERNEVPGEPQGSLLACGGVSAVLVTVCPSKYYQEARERDVKRL